MSGLTRPCFPFPSFTRPGGWPHPLGHLGAGGALRGPVPGRGPQPLPQAARFVRSLPRDSLRRSKTGEDGVSVAPRLLATGCPWGRGPRSLNSWSCVCPPDQSPHPRPRPAPLSPQANGEGDSLGQPQPSRGGGKRAVSPQASETAPCGAGPLCPAGRWDGGAGQLRRGCGRAGWGTPAPGKQHQTNTCSCVQRAH